MDDEEGALLRLLREARWVVGAGRPVLPLVLRHDGRLPMEDHNTRIVVFGSDGQQARELAEELVKNAFHNVAYFDGILTALQPDGWT